MLLLTVLILTACPNSYEVPERVQLKINVVGLDFLSGEADSLKSAPMDVFSDFEHIYAHTEILIADYHDLVETTFISGNGTGG